MKSKGYCSAPYVDVAIMLFVAGVCIGILIGFLWAGKDNVSRRVVEDDSTYYVTGETPEN